MAALEQSGYQVLPIGIDTRGTWSVQSASRGELEIRDGRLPAVVTTGDVVSPSAGGSLTASNARSLADVDVVFPVLHGPWGEDGTIQGLLELAAVPYVGSGVFASAAAMDKAQCKRLISSHGIPVVPSVLITSRDWLHDREACLRQCAGLGLPVFVKPSRAGSSIGISKVNDATGLAAAIDAAASHDPRVLVEAAVASAREIEVGVIADAQGKPKASVPAEVIVRSGHEFYDFAAKYLDDAVDLVVPADVPEGTTKELQRIACQAFEVLGCEGLARIDFFIAADGTVLLNEINTMPGFTSISLFPRMWAASGLDYPALVDHLVRDALRRGTGLR
ncbi:MAG: hypothetical protein RL745_407 [Actinomycetota bacterium]|jgi:D-alanine-D-alanine ligase